MKDEKKVKATEEAKPEENGTKLTDEELTQVVGGLTGGDTRGEYTINPEDINRSIYGALY